MEASIDDVATLSARRLAVHLVNQRAQSRLSMRRMKLNAVKIKSFR